MEPNKKIRLRCIFVPYFFLLLWSQHNFLYLRLVSILLSGTCVKPNDQNQVQLILNWINLRRWFIWHWNVTRSCSFTSSTSPRLILLVVAQELTVKRARGDTLMHFWRSAVYLSYLFFKVMLSLSYAVTEFLLFIVQKVISCCFLCLVYISTWLVCLFFFFFLYLWTDLVTEPTCWWSQLKTAQMSVCF